MKKCEYCGYENPDESIVCRECGEPVVSEIKASDCDTEQPVARWKKVAVLGGEVEAERLELALKNLEIPHVLVSYRDSAMDGLYQNAKGWGHIEAAEEYREAILSCLQDLRGAALDGAPPETDQA
jgi:hypothetical protein